MAVATFNAGPCTGTIRFTQESTYTNSHRRWGEWGEVRIQTEIASIAMVTNDCKDWSIHENIVSSNTPCDDATLGDRYNPFSATSLGCQPDQRCSCAVGNLGNANVHGPLNIWGVSLLTDPLLSLSGDYSIVGRSITISNNIGDRVGCAKIELEN